MNHEAWAIPYADLLTLLLAFFVVMYAMSSVNEGKYRVLSDSLAAAFRGSPRTLQPVQVGEKQVDSGADLTLSRVQQAMIEGQPRQMLEPAPLRTSDVLRQGMAQALDLARQAEAQDARQRAALAQLASEVEQAMQPLIEQALIVVRRQGAWVEVEIRTDILFPSGVATLSPQARDVLQRLAQVLLPFPNPIRVEGHTDTVPINTPAFPSNWELSAARAASVVHVFSRVGMDPARLVVVGLGEHRPIQSNDSVAGRNANRRVLLVVLSDGTPEDMPGVPSAALDDLSIGLPIDAAVAVAPLQ